MPNVNLVILAGNLTTDPELRYTQDGTAVCSLQIAVNRNYTTPTGEKKEEVVFVKVTVWRKQAESCAEYLKKGRPVMVEGRLKMNKWTTPDGQKRSNLEVVATRVQFLGTAPAGGKTAAADESPAPPLPPEAEDEHEENIPF